MPNPRFQCALLVCLLSLGSTALPTAARAEGPDPSVDEILNGGTERLHRLADSTPAQVLDQLAIEAPTRCDRYRSTEALERRAKRWTFAVQLLGRTHPDFVYGWATGTEPPPDRVLEEVRTMRNCMLDALFRAASRPDSDLTVELELENGHIRSPDRARQWAASYRERPRRRERMREAVTKSMYRPVSDQTAIWQRKVRFHGAAFDAISEVAADRCHLDAGDPWIPEARRHERCWRRRLTPQGRGREILTVSAPPGLSRHHWGSEIDLFGVTRKAFRPGGPRHDEYRWMKRRAADWGFFQVYGPGAESYSDERWHWSYAPIAGALMEFAVEHREPLRRRLDAIWRRIERRHNRQFPTELSFGYVRDHWERYLVGISAPPW